MEQIYHWIGLVVFWLSVPTGLFIIFQFAIMWMMNILCKKWNSIWMIVEFGYYKKDFKNWVKNKNRHPKCE